MTFEIIVFIAAVLFGIILYWTESKSNRLYRFFNKLTHSKELQMKPESRKGFVHQQDFLMRLVWITLLYLIAAAVIAVVLPFVVNYIQYFISAIVATLLGTYIASLFLFARDKTKKENLEKAFNKGKESIDEFTQDIRDNFESEEEIEPEPKPSTEPDEPKLSARERLKNKGMIK
ncbi:hypothetical protein K8089_07295 [Aequorivita sp. F47161]|uniref:Uncharacterized protein n=1 Tax=Aequorivita vitellina TaxID=2874475 RepID=A0A9X1QTW7_9FLAO|nr:hypothetical protein [Aequorivita vitellina]MCG2418823.1 hypothetical protein [Aequorivita vitellina]MCZ4319005.1 hypothetical protein [Aequorivita viscosa]